MNEEKIIAILKEQGPMTGAMLVEKTDMEVLSLWQACRKSPSIRFETSGRRFLRLDRNVEGYARLSPSIRREFLTYTCIGLDFQAGAIKEKADALRGKTERISREKRDVALKSIVSTIDIIREKEAILAKTCFIIAGDVVYDMSHNVPRPEPSTGEMVRGSDLDIIGVTEDDLDPEIIRSLDGYIHKRKHMLLVNEREEIDYLIKPLSRVKQQLEFKTFESMIASKILHEGQLLYGNTDVFRKVKDLIVEYGIPEKLDRLERQASGNRDLAEEQLLDINAETESSEYLNLFFTRAEEDEIY